jgi:DNA replication protein DnaC
MDDEIPDRSPAPDGRRRHRQVAAERALVEAAWEASTTPAIRRRLRRGGGLAIVVAVPSASWVNPLGKYLAELASEAEDFSRDGQQRTKHVPTEGNEEVSQALAKGSTVLGVSQAAERLLPSVLVAAADMTIRIGPPDTATVAKAMRRCLRGRIPSDLPADLAATLDFNEIVAAMRKGSKPTQAAARMRATTTARNKGGTDIALPTLNEADFYGEARAWGLRLAQDVEAAKRGDIAWSQVDRGVLFYGPPGTGKSWLARIVAQQCRLPYIESSVAELFASSAGFLDSVIKAERDVFARAAAAAPCILFLDELDALPNRATISPRGKDWWQPVITDFMLQLASTPPGVITIAATNRLEDIDVAILRPGRLERTIEVRPPATAEGLAGILTFHLGNDLAGTDLVPIARLGLGATAAVAMEWVRAARRAARQAGRDMIAGDLLAVIAPPDCRSREELRRTAVHEAGHVVAAIVLGIGPIRHASMIMNGSSGGVTKLVEGGNIAICGRSRIERYVIVSLAGRAAEIVALGGPSAGASGGPESDLATATRTVTAIHASLSLADSLVYRAPASKADDLLMLDPVLRALVERDLRRLHKSAEGLVRRYRPALESIADALLVRRYLAGDEIARLFNSACAEKSGHDAAAEAEDPEGREEDAADGGFV